MFCKFCAYQFYPVKFLKLLVTIFLQIFQGNRDHNNVVRNNFPAPVTARYFRLLVQTWHGTSGYYTGLRVEYYTC